MKTPTLLRSACAAAVVLAGVGLASGVASAEGSDPSPTRSEVYVSPSSTVAPETLPEVLNETEQSGEAEAATAQGAEADAAPDSLAFTGSDAMGLAVVGGVVLAAGVAITVTRRRTADA